MDQVYNAFTNTLLFNPVTASTTLAYNWWNDQPLLSNPITGQGQKPMLSPLLVAALAIGGGYLLFKAMK